MDKTLGDITQREEVDDIEDLHRVMTAAALERQAKNPSAPKETSHML